MSGRSKQSSRPNALKAPSSTKCRRCNGSGMICYEQKAEVYAKENGRENIYPAGTLLWVAAKCPDCNGGFDVKVSIAKKSSGIPETFYDKGIDEFDWSMYVKEDGTECDTSIHEKIINSIINEYDKWEKDCMGLYIWSNTKGTGKTFLASCICNELMSKYAIRTRFVNASDLIDISQSGDMESYDEYKRNPMKLLYECKFLVIDDLGQKKNSDWLEDLLYKIIDERMRNKRQTMITSNMMIHSLPYDDRLRSRLEATCVTLHLPEAIIRSKESREKKNGFFKEIGLMEG